MTISALLAWLITGLVVGGLAHPLVPGRQRIGILLTLLFGIVGALVGGIVTAAIIGAGHFIITFLVSLVVAALLIAAVSHPRAAATSTATGDAYCASCTTCGGTSSPHIPPTGGRRENRDALRAVAAVKAWWLP